MTIQYLRDTIPDEYLVDYYMQFLPEIKAWEERIQNGDLSPLILVEAEEFINNFLDSITDFDKKGFKSSWLLRMKMLQCTKIILSS